MTIDIPTLWLVILAPFWLPVLLVGLWFYAATMLVIIEGVVRMVRASFARHRRK